MRGTRGMRREKERKGKVNRRMRERKIDRRKPTRLIPKIYSSCESKWNGSHSCTFWSNHFWHAIFSMPGFFILYAHFSSKYIVSLLCGVPSQIVYVPYNFYLSSARLLWNVLLLFNNPVVPLISPKNHTIIKRTHSEIKLLLLNNNVICTENIALIYVLHGGCVRLCLFISATIRFWWLWCRV